MDSLEATEELRELSLVSGVSRLADITRLDRLGFPVVTGIRPIGRILRVVSGKGETVQDAALSALMEALEHAACEAAPESKVTCSEAELRRHGADCVGVAMFRSRKANIWTTADRPQRWINVAEIGGTAPVLLPAESVFFLDPAMLRLSTNGMGAADTIQTAFAHGLLEIVERELATILEQFLLTWDISRLQVIRLESIIDEQIWDTCKRICREDMVVHLLSIKHAFPVHFMCAVILDNNPLDCSCAVSIGNGVALHPAEAAGRAIREAAQTRLVRIHGAREDLITGYERSGMLLSYMQLSRLAGKEEWLEWAGTKVAKSVDEVAAFLISCGHRIFTYEHSSEIYRRNAVRVIVPTLGMPIESI